MKKNIVGMVVAAAAFLTLGNATTASAETLEAIQQQQEQKHQEISSLQKEVNTVLEEVSELSFKLAELDQDISEKEEALVETEAEVVAQEEVVAARLEQARSRLQSLQLNETAQNMVLTILESDSLSDLFNRALVVMRLTDASNQQIVQAEEEVQQLVELQNTLEESQAALKTSRAEAVVQKETFDEKISTLQTLIKENESELTTLVEKEAAEIARIEEARRVAREEAARAEAKREAEERAKVQAKEQAEEQAKADRAAARATAEKNNSANEGSTSSSSSSSSVQAAEQSKPAKNQSAKASQPSNNETASQPSQPAAQPNPAPAKSEPAKPEPSNNQSTGRTMQVQATGYSTRQPSLSTHTATGIDLRVNPRVIAVDPSVIPLGTMVEVEGMGVYIAGDTGGAIKGNIIDIHFQTVAEALQWGRRNVTIRILK